MWSSVTLVVMVTLRLVVGAEPQEVEMHTTSGLVKGYVSDLMDATATTKGRVARFYGIPYANPPLSNNRFEPSKPFLSFSDAMYGNLVNNTSSPPPCPQPAHRIDFADDSIQNGGNSTSEDCLKLNLYKPVLDSVSAITSKPVLIWIPGDGFNYADAAQFDGSAMAVKGDMIVVTVNYRVGVFGFLSSGNQSLPGNAGLHDILNAIQWVRKNCRAFHGDETRITLAGRYSGSMAISALIVSPMFLHPIGTPPKEAPLVQRIIMHGGVAHGRWTINYEPHEALTLLAKLTGCKGNQDEKIACLKVLSTETLLNASMTVPRLWKPVIDHTLLLDDPLHQIATEGVEKYPSGLSLLIGDNIGAGSLCYLPHYKAKHSLQDLETVAQRDFQGMVAGSLLAYYNMEVGINAASALVAHEYTYSPIPSIFTKSNLLRWLYFCGLMHIRHPTECMARSVAEDESTMVFRYEFSHRSDKSRWGKWLWAPNGHEVAFLFPTNRTKLPKDDQEVQKLLIDSWASFIKTGTPSTANFTWPRYDSKTRKIVRIGSAKPDKGKSAKEAESFLSINSTTYLDRDVHFWNHSIKPMMHLLHHFEKLSESMTTYPMDVGDPVPNCPSKSIACPVVLGLTIVVFVLSITSFALFLHRHRIRFGASLPCRF